jgi:hypothetical protein
MDVINHIRKIEEENKKLIIENERLKNQNKNIINDRNNYWSRMKSLEKELNQSKPIWTPLEISLFTGWEYTIDKN